MYRRWIPECGYQTRLRNGYENRVAGPALMTRSEPAAAVPSEDEIRTRALAVQNSDTSAILDRIDDAEFRSFSRKHCESEAAAFRALCAWQKLVGANKYRASMPSVFVAVLLTKYPMCCASRCEDGQLLQIPCEPSLISEPAVPLLYGHDNAVRIGRASCLWFDHERQQVRGFLIPERELGGGLADVFLDELLSGRTLTLSPGFAPVDGRRTLCEVSVTERPQNRHLGVVDAIY